MTCRDVRSLLKAGRLPEEGGPVAHHVTECPCCKRAVAATRVERTLLQSLDGGVAPPPGFAERVRRRLPALEPRSVEAEKAAWHLGRRLVPGLALVALLVGGVTLWLGPEPGGVPLPGEALAGPPIGERLVVSDLPLSRELILASVVLGGEGSRE